jgi:chromosome segregation ATPase
MAKELIKQRDYEARTIELRAEFENANSNISNLEQNKNKYEKIIEGHKEQINKLAKEKIDLTRVISEQNSDILRKKDELAVLEKEKSNNYLETVSQEVEIDNLNKKIKYLLVETEKSEDKYSSIIKSVNASSELLEKTKQQINILDEEIKNKTERINEKELKTILMEKELEELIAYNNKQKDLIHDEKTRMNIYCERLNKLFEDIGQPMNIKLFK